MAAFRGKRGCGKDGSVGTAAPLWVTLHISDFWNQASISHTKYTNGEQINKTNKGGGILTNEGTREN